MKLRGRPQSSAPSCKRPVSTFSESVVERDVRVSRIKQKILEEVMDIPKDRMSHRKGDQKINVHEQQVAKERSERDMQFFQACMSKRTWEQIVDVQASASREGDP